MPGPPLTDHERQTILDLIGQDLSRNEIARRTGRSTDTITRIANSIGHDFLAAVDRTTQATLARAHETNRAFGAERRALLAARITAECESLLDAMHQPHKAFSFGGRDNTYAEHEMPEPPTGAKRELMQSVHLGMRTVLDISKHDVKPDEAGPQGMLVALVDGMRAGSDEAQPEAG